MNSLLQKIKSFPQEELSYEALGQFVKDLDLKKLDYKAHVPYDCEPGDYGRNILCLEPFECVLIYWPPATESAIHYHKGFYGYVALLEGELDNIEYDFRDGILGEARAARYLPGGIADEPDLTIHKLANPNPEKGAVSLHFYYPALNTLEDLAIYDIETTAEGILSATAKSASWSEKEGHFKSLRKNAFQFRDMAAYHADRSHLMFPLIPKPDSEKIGKMVGAYYCEQAEEYDNLDQSYATRQAYIERINSIVAESLAQLSEVDEVVHIASGTGRRALEIRDQVGGDYKIMGIDISAKMCEVAAAKDIQLVNAGWIEVQLSSEKQFCGAVWLYAFGHLSSRSVRLQALKKINRHLKIGAPLLMDVFNVHNKNEWGPSALKAFHSKGLGRYGYEEGDVFYKRTNGRQIAFLHYFSQEEIIGLLEESGFVLDRMWNIAYAVDSGQLKENPSEGFFMIRALKDRVV